MWLKVKVKVVARRSGDGIEGVPSTGSGLHPTFRTVVCVVADAQPDPRPVARTTRANLAGRHRLIPNNPAPPSSFSFIGRTEPCLGSLRLLTKCSPRIGIPLTSARRASYGTLPITGSSDGSAGHCGYGGPGLSALSPTTRSPTRARRRVSTRRRLWPSTRRSGRVCP
jgi:hypothetical protein